MLGRTNYSAAYIEACRARVARLLDAFDKAKPKEPFAGAVLLEMVLGLEMAFVHRVRMNEGKDGNPLNEVRMIVASVLEYDGVMSRDNTIKWDAGKSVTGIALGQRIVVTRTMVEQLAEAFLGEIERKYG